MVKEAQASTGWEVHSDDDGIKVSRREIMLDGGVLQESCKTEVGDAPVTAVTHTAIDAHRNGAVRLGRVV
jgi:hypothetical protein